MYGDLGFIGIGREPGFGSATAATDYIEALSEGVSASIDRFEQVNIINGLYEPDDVDGIRRVGGDIAIPAHPVSLGYFLNGACGQNTVTSITGSLFQNVFTMTTSNFGVDTFCPLPSYTLEIFRDVTSSQQYTGCAVSNLTLSAAPNQPLQATATFVGKEANIIAATTASFPTDSVYPFSFDTCSISIAGVANAKQESINIGISNQLEGVPVLNASQFIAKIRRTGSQIITIGGTVEFDSLTDYDLFEAQTDQAITLHFTQVTSHSLLLEFPRVVYTTFPMGIGGRERLTIGWEGKVRYHTGSASAFKATLTTVQSGF